MLCSLLAYLVSKGLVSKTSAVQNYVTVSRESAMTTGIAGNSKWGNFVFI